MRTATHKYHYVKRQCKTNEDNGGSRQAQAEGGQGTKGSKIKDKEPKVAKSRTRNQR